MAIRHTEKPKSRPAVVDFKNPTTKRMYSIWGSDDKNEILLYLASIMPAMDTTIDATTGAVIPLFPAKVDCDPFSQDTWDATVHYEGSPDTVDVSFQLGVQSVKIYEALARIRTYDLINGGIDTPDVPNYGTTIGVQSDGEVEGTEIEVGKVEFCITRKWRTGELDPAYVMVLRDMTDRTAVNDATFTFLWLGQAFNFPKGTLRIRGAPMKWDGTGALEIGYHFAYQRSILKPTSPYALWAIGSTYAAGDRVRWAGIIWQSAGAGNIGNEPIEYPLWSPTFTYSVGDRVTLSGFNYESLIDNNLDQLLSDPAKWQNLGLSEWTFVESAVFTGDFFQIGNSDYIEKEGWHYGWVAYKTTTLNGMITKTPFAYTVDQVYPYDDFGKLHL